MFLLAPGDAHALGRAPNQQTPLMRCVGPWAGRPSPSPRGAPQPAAAQGLIKSALTRPAPRPSGLSGKPPGADPQGTDAQGTDAQGIDSQAECACQQPKLPWVSHGFPPPPRLPPSSGFHQTGQTSKAASGLHRGWGERPAAMSPPRKHLKTEAPLTPGELSFLALGAQVGSWGTQGLDSQGTRGLGVSRRRGHPEPLCLHPHHGPKTPTEGEGLRDKAVTPSPAGSAGRPCATELALGWGGGGRSQCCSPRWSLGNRRPGPAGPGAGTMERGLQGKVLSRPTE